MISLWFHVYLIKPKTVKENDDHEDWDDGHGQYLIVEGDAAEFSVVRYLFFVVFKSPDFCDKYTDQDTADRHQQICGEGVQPVIDSQHVPGRWRPSMEALHVA